MLSKPLFKINYFRYVIKMNNKNSASSERNKMTWLENLVNFQDSLKKKTIIPLEEQTLEIKNRIQLKI